ncbi:MAG TPA: phasin family protein, partial [Xanthobacteraceae bacterium]|nr:phasin family protein [Xanthobacteraceae bacterium]
AVEVHSDFLKSSYEGFVARSGKFGQLYADLAKETYKPLEGYFGKAS